MKFFCLLAILLGSVCGTQAARAQPARTTDSCKEGQPLFDFDVETAKPSERPDIVVFLLDDLDELTSPYWEVMPASRRMFRDGGAVFKAAFSSTPTCCPSRASLFTGLYCHNSRVLSNGLQGGIVAFTKPRDDSGKRLTDAKGYCVNNENRSIAVALREAGYKTALFGKYLNVYGRHSLYVPTGWSKWFVQHDHNFFSGYDYSIYSWDEDHKATARDRRFGNRPQDYVTDVLRDAAVDYVKGVAGTERPLFVMVAPSAPHMPLPPAPRHRKLAKAWEDKVPSSPNYFEAELSDKPKWIAATRPQWSATKEFNRKDFRRRMGSLYAVDELIAQVSETLQKSRPGRKRIFIFASDNGYSLGSHGLSRKTIPYEESVRVPLAISGSGIPKLESGELVVLHDLAPTILELAKVRRPEWMDGMSLVPLLAPGASPKWRQDVLFEYLASEVKDGAEVIKLGSKSSAWKFAAEFESPPYRAVRTKGRVLIDWFTEKNGRYELYDLEKDPYQLRNLLRSSPSQDFTLLLQRLESLSHCRGASCN